MTPLALAAACVLAVTFAISAGSKLRDWSSFPRAVSAFGVPGRLAVPAAVAVVVLEVASAVALLAPGTWAIGGAVTAAALLAAFTVGIIVNLTRGRHPPCNCFGQASQEPLSWRSVMRNAVLLALTVPVLAAGPDNLPGLVPWLRDRSAAEATLLAGALVAATVAVSAYLLGRLVARAVDRLRVDVRASGGRAAAVPTAPMFALPDLDGNARSLTDMLAAGRPVLLFFMSPSCGPCRALAPDVREWTRASAGALTVAVISDGAPEDNREEFGDDVVVLLQRGREIQDLYEIDGTPALVLLGADGVRVLDPAYGADEIRSLVADLSPQPEPAPHVHQIEPRPLGPGDGLPAGEVSAVDGRTVRLPDDLPAETTLLFWDTTCGFAEAIRDDVLAWQAERGSDTELVVVNRGEADQVASVGFRGLVLIDPSFAVGRSVGAPGTPSAVRVRDGRLASDVAAGGPDVLALLGAAKAT